MTAASPTTTSKTKTKTKTRNTGSTTERLKIAALTLIGEHGYHGATTRAIAAEAGVSEVTLFRRFGSKAELTAAALAHVTEGFRSAGAQPTDDVFDDLMQLGSEYQRFVDRWPGLVARLLAEAAVESEIGAVVSRLIAENARSTAGIVTHHQQAGRLIEAPVDTITSAFLGPILLGATVGRFLSGSEHRKPTRLDVAAHTARFLDGHRR